VSDPSRRHLQHLPRRDVDQARARDGAVEESRLPAGTCLALFLDDGDDDVVAETIEEGQRMNWDQIEGKWKQLKGRVRETWGSLTDDDLDKIGGKRERLAGLVQEKYGVAKDEAERQIAKFERALDA
jgi:uncharacterized protein YjbJ (UPF0337 family)